MRNIVEEVIKSSGGVSRLAKQLGITHNSIYSWKNIPPMRVLQVERITGISRHDLRPDLYPRHLEVEGAE